MDADEKIFQAFRTLRSERLYFSQIKEQTKLSNSSLQNALERLEKRRIIGKEQTKANAFYALKDRRIAALRFAALDLARFDALHNTVRLPLLDFMQRLPAALFAVVLFGSAGRKSEGRSSDIDLLVLVHAFPDKQFQARYEQTIIALCEQAKKDAEAASIHPLNIVFATIEKYRQDDDHLLLQAKSTGFPIMNHQQYYETMLR